MLPHPDYLHHVPNPIMAYRPMIHSNLCGKCGTCAQMCRMQAINHLHNGNYEVFLDYCVGCGVCSQVCPNGAIEMVEVGGIAVLA